MIRSQFHMYDTDYKGDDSLYHDCLLYNGDYFARNSMHLDNQGRQLYQTISYCIRCVGLTSNILVNNGTSVMHGTSVTFETLRQKNITSHELYLSFAPIDVVERYEEFLENFNSPASTQVFNNCTKPWFGEYCQYSFNLTWPFNVIISAYFTYLPEEKDNLLKNGTCYIFIQCNRGPPPSCLDWREICDGKIDCLNGGQDEIDCDKLDMNECKEDEFRCSNGFCIPNEFFNDDSLNSDCIDRSDEKYDNYEDPYRGQKLCKEDPMFRCEETACRTEHLLSCGNGHCSISSCSSGRDIQLERAKLSQNANPDLSYNCWKSLICLTISMGDRLELFKETTCQGKNNIENLFRENCPALFSFPATPIVLHHVYFIYLNNQTFEYRYGILSPYYVCYDQELCNHLPATVSINGLTCRNFSELDLDSIWTAVNILKFKILEFFLKCSTVKTYYDECPKSKPYRCMNSSKCIALDRLLDGVFDCLHEDDERTQDSCKLPDIEYRFQCSSEYKCIPLASTNKIKGTCIGGEDKYNNALSVKRMTYYLSFTVLCDGFIDHSNIDGSNYTDEMDCQDWPCNNIYTRCDGKWNCPNASDEANCLYNPCRPHGHSCILSYNHNFTCLPLSKINDGHIDCLGGYDETDRCGSMLHVLNNRNYRCLNETQCIFVYEICAPKVKYCSSGDDQKLYCEKVAPFFNQFDSSSIYQQHNDFNYHRYFYHIVYGLKRNDYVYFTVKNHLIYPRPNEVISNEHNSDVTIPVTTTAPIQFKFEEPINRFTHGLSSICKRGVPVYINNFTQNLCLCPPAYFGYRCEYQSQRISLTLRFRTVELRTMFTFIIILLDDLANIHSFEKLNYLSVRDCRKKFSVYLLYSTQPKHANKTYYIRIDTYGTINKKYYISMYYPIQYSFLPVYRISLQIDVPMLEAIPKSNNCSLKCIHGQCRQYLNANQYFCQCINGYTGFLCTIKNKCDCSSDSICIGVVKNRSICICPLNKFGPRCYLQKTACNSHLCSNDSQCIPGDENQAHVNNYFCLCSEGYTGPRCLQIESKIEFHFHQSISFPQAVFIHFVYIPQKSAVSTSKYPPDPTQTTIISKLNFYESSTFVYHGGEFHLIFLQLNQYYYLALLQHNYTLKANYSTTIIPEHRCLSIHDLLPEYTLALPRWRRAKSFHIPCQQHPNLVCFYDNDYFMCLCDIDRYPNCFKFNYKPAYNCLGYNHCENDGQCYQDNNTCPTSASCFCKECYYGNRCQFTTKGFGLSLDDILGYNIHSKLSFSQQPTVVKVSTAVTIMIFIIALINGILSILTFQTKGSRTFGCGLYLLISSITSLLTMTIFTIKFFLLILSQMSIIINHSFLLSNCICADIFLKTSLAIGEWLNACVNVERTFTVILGVKFDKARSKKVAKRMIFGLCFFILASFIHDPLHRDLLEDSEEQRTWCVVRYSKPLKTYASFINIFHFLVPFGINLLCGISIIVLMARRKVKIHQRQTYQQHLLEQFHQQKYRLLTSFGLVLIAMPRLIISLVSKCMKSARNPWLYIIGYYISFVSPLLTFILFVIPSDFYRKEFIKTVNYIRVIIRC